MAEKGYKKTAELPPIPDKRYFTIGEVGDLCQLKPHVLRYWEQEFKQLSPTKRRGNRRYYRHEDVQIVRRIRELLYDRGFTLNGARTELSAKRVKQQTLNIPKIDPPALELTPAPAPVAIKKPASFDVKHLVNQLEDVLQLLK